MRVRVEGIGPAYRPLHTQVEVPVKEKVGKALETLSKYAITATGMLPFSSRGIPANLLRTPLRLVQSLFVGVKEGVHNRSITSFGSKFMHQIVKYMKRDWRGGISDSYKELGSARYLEKGRELARQNLRYAGYLYQRNLQGDDGRGFEKVDWNGFPVFSRSSAFLSPETKETFSELVTVIKRMGFHEDDQGRFYDLITGTIFSLVYDKDQSEIIVCFEGLGNEQTLDVANEIKQRMGSAGAKAALSDFFGGVPDSVVQAIELGKRVKEIAEKAGMTPVMVGHSHGGGIAQCAAAANGIRGVVFNSRPMGAGVRRYIGQSQIAKSAKNIRVFAGKGDFLSRNKGINVVATLTERVTGMPVPRTVGKGYNLPSASVPPGMQIAFNLQHLLFYEQLHELLKQPEVHHA